MTNKSNNFRHEFGIHIVKRDAVPLAISVIIRAVAIILSLIVCAAVLLAITGNGPLQLVQSMLYGNFGTDRKIWLLLTNLSILQCLSLAVTPAFRMKFWNLGAEGQALIGALVSVILMLKLGNTFSRPITLIIIAAAAMICGMIWGLIPAAFKARFGTNETLFTLMMNYIAMQLVLFCIPFIDKSGSNVIRSIRSPWENSRFWFPDIFGSRYGLIVIIAAVLTILMFIYLKYSKHGYEISVVGESENTARYIGINVKKVIIRTMLLSGAICGLAGLLLVAGTDHSLTRDTVGGRGFTAIMVSWLAKFNPIYMVLTSFLLVFLEKGAIEISTKFGLNNSFSEILTGIIIFFIIGSEFFINYSIKFRESKKGANN